MEKIKVLASRTEPSTTFGGYPAFVIAVSVPAKILFASKTTFLIASVRVSVIAAGKKTC